MILIHFEVGLFAHQLSIPKIEEKEKSGFAPYFILWFVIP
jgi:hypothetical protein